MNRFITRPLLVSAALLLLLVGCQQESELHSPQADETTPASKSFKLRNGVENNIEVREGANLQRAVVGTESFETGSKTSYADGNVTLTTDSWFFNDAVIGTTTSDRKNGTKSARLRNYAEIGNNTPYTGGVGTVTLKAAVYGADAASSLELWVSGDGTNYAKVGNTVNVSSTTLTTYTFTVNRTGNVYLDLYKSDGTASRLNIDDVAVTAYSGGGTGGGTTPGVAGRDNHLALGNPSGAIASASVPNNYLAVKNEFVIGYNNSKGTPNWVSWHLSNAWIGSQGRTDAFRADASLPSTFYKPNENSYAFATNGFDRGHICPSADRTTNATENQATFLMSNMMPQAPNNNQIVWNNMEAFERSLAVAGNEMYIISGPSRATGGSSAKGFFNTIDGGRIAVPAYTWKVIVVLPNGSNDATRITTATRVIAVIVPNNQSVNSQPWGFYRTTVDRIESENGLDIMSTISTAIQSTLESRVDTGSTN